MHIGTCGKHALTLQQNHLLPIAAKQKLQEKLVLLPPYALQSILMSAVSHLNGNNVPVLAGMPTLHHASERQLFHDTLVPAVHDQFALLVDTLGAQNRVFDWYDRHDNEQHVT
ncbi:Uncharacterised protein [Acinetobacter baumannii]|nr:Uncharacterised protein [Acinetobacter baumannii]